MDNGTSIIVEIAGRPVPWQRTGGHGKVRFTQPKTRAWKNLAELNATLIMKGRKPLTRPLLLTYTAVFCIPQSWPKWKRNAATDGHIAMTSKPDLDNLVKITKDAFNKIVYVDDAQVTIGQVTKQYGLSEKVIVEITPVNQLPNTCTQDELQEFLRPLLDRSAA